MKIGLIGCGKQSGKHINGLRGQDDVDIVVCDIDAGRAEATGKEFGLAWTADVDGLFSDAALDAVNIATPTLTHAALAQRAVDAGKHFFCEKPLCRSLDEARALAEGVRAAGLVGMVGYVYRYSPVFEAGQALCATSPLGRPVTAHFRIGGRGEHELWKHRRETSGGAVSEMLVHMLDLALWYLGPVSNAELLSHELLRPERRIGGQDVTVDAEDFALVRLTTAAGCTAYIQADLLSPAFSQYVEMQFERGSFMGSIQGDFPSFVFAQEAAGEYAQGKTLFDFGSVNLFERQMVAFCDHIRSGRALEKNSIDDSLQLMEALEMLQQQ